MTEDERPKPGSNEAIAAGCTCAVIDNNRGRFAPFPPDGWWITATCPIHAVADADDGPDEEWLAHDHPEEIAREDYALDRFDVGGPVPPTEARRRAEARRADGRPNDARYWDAYAEAGEADRAGGAPT